MLIVRSSAQFRKSLKRILKSGTFSRDKLQKVVNQLARGEKLHPSFRDHELSGTLAGHRECHIKRDLLLIYRIENNNLVLVLVNLGSHSELFN